MSTKLGRNPHMLGKRLKEERERLGLTQDEFAEIAGAGRRTLIDWEKGVSSPKAEQLEVLSDHGVDVYYVLTNVRIGLATTLTARESALVENYRASDDEAKKALETTSAALAQSPGAIKKAG